MSELTWDDVEEDPDILEHGPTPIGKSKSKPSPSRFTTVIVDGVSVKVLDAKDAADAVKKARAAVKSSRKARSRTPKADRQSP